MDSEWNERKPGSVKVPRTGSGERGVSNKIRSPPLINQCEETMKKRRPMSRKESGKNFTKNAVKVKPINNMPRPQRGGIRL